jgi:hypothetical protein
VPSSEVTFLLYNEISRQGFATILCLSKSANSSAMAL